MIDNFLVTELDLKSLFKEKRVEFIYDQLISKLESPEILDVGCGDGRKLAKLIIEKGISPKNYYGIDIQENDLNEIKKLGINTYKQDLSVSNLDFEILLDSKKFDLVLIIEVLEHFSTLIEKHNILNESVKCLKKGKHLAMTFPSHPGVSKSKYGHKNMTMNIDEILKVIEEKFNKIYVFYDKVTYAILCLEKIND